MIFYELKYYLYYLIVVVMVLISVAFLTLFERKILSYIQVRKGPNKVGFMGIAQPFSDAIKLFTKEQTFPILSNFSLYYLSPVFSLGISLIMWAVFPLVYNLLTFNLGLIFIFCLSSLSVYGVMMAGWSSNSNYSLLGSLRSIAQTISYEVSLVFLVLSFIIFTQSYNLLSFSEFQSNIWLGLILFPVSILLLSTFLAETNRTPFDLAEGESELVSGFNVEYSSGGFAMIFLAEYSSILFMSFFSSMLFLGGDFYTLVFFIKVIFISFVWIWVRGTLPRIRYDMLMNLTWTGFLPISLSYFLLNFNLVLLFYILKY
uniref:NADH-ubiquinone oxidoreductase chain 1 n=1 Tax=Brontispa longissima TaxID=111217 RepID=A0A7T8V7U5_BROLO|nr:NADH dehydrogenase subunit 1 [Brontispa longissima]QQQ89061.1 NADH dehydrogenase subunit 1 [Brontispa longissima]UAJ48104.1 NADH dehydrogenase subunit 1 [Brontispa longissima]